MVVNVEQSHISNVDRPTPDRSAHVRLARASEVSNYANDELITAIYYTRYMTLGPINPRSPRFWIGPRLITEQMT